MLKKSAPRETVGFVFSVTIADYVQWHYAQVCHCTRRKNEKQ